MASSTRTYLDVQGLTCPIPLLQTKRQLRTMEAGDLVEVQATDPDTEDDFRAFCDGVVCELLSSERDGPTYRYVVRKL